jgi:glutamate-1-semialdehyde aminotransferase
VTPTEELPLDRAWLDRAERVTVGASQTNSRRHGKVGPVTFPAFARAGAGAYLRLTDDSLVIDLAGANGAVALGYQAHVVTGSMHTHFMEGGTLSLPTTLEVETSERMVQALPFPSLVRWVRTGSEAVSAAVAIAQEATGRAQIGKFKGSYHGWHPWTRSLVQEADDLDLGSSLVARGIAAILVESPRWKTVDDAYIRWLTQLREDCTAQGVLLIFDDVVYAFRFATGGLQETTGVRPDLACFSKALGNGVPVGCVTGIPDLMTRTGFRVSSTFGGEILGLAAASAVLELHAEMDVCGKLREIGVDLRQRLDDALTDTPISVYGTPQHFRFVAAHGKGDAGSTLDAFLTCCMRDETQRVLIHRDADNVNLAMTADVREMIAGTVGRAARQC